MDWVTPATTLLAAVVGGIGGAVAGFIAAKKSESYRYRQWLVDKRISLYQEFVEAYRDIAMHNSVLMHDPGNESESERLLRWQRNDENLTAICDLSESVLEVVDENWLVVDQGVAWKMHYYLGEISSRAWVILDKDLREKYADQYEPRELHGDEFFTRGTGFFWLERGEDEIIEAMRKSLISTELAILRPGVKHYASTESRKDFDRLSHAFFNPAAFARTRLGKLIREFKYRRIFPRVKRSELPK